MNKKLAELIVTKSADYYDKAVYGFSDGLRDSRAMDDVRNAAQDMVVNALEDAGFVVILSDETTTETYYIIAGREGKE